MTRTRPPAVYTSCFAKWWCPALAPDLYPGAANMNAQHQFLFSRCCYICFSEVSVVVADFVRTTRMTSDLKFRLYSKLIFVFVM